jgi:hypothetical protein
LKFFTIVILRNYVEFQKRIVSDNLPIPAETAVTAVHNGRFHSLDFYEIYLVFLNVNCAFDSVDHKIRLFDGFSAHDNALNWLQS